MTELPPAVAKYIADADPFVRGTSTAVEAAKKFDRDASKAALSARRMGLAAKEAGEKAALATRAAAEGAEKAAKGLLKEEQAARLAARAVRELERASLAEAAAAIASAEASDKAASAYRKQAAGSASATKSATLMRSELVTLAAAAVAIAPAFIAAGGGAVAFGALAIPAVKKVIDAQTEMADTWDSLSARQKVSAAATRTLVTDYKSLAKAVEPDTLKVYNGALAVTAQIMPRLEPITRATSRALLDFEDNLGRALDSPEARQFTTWIESQAGPSIGVLGDTLGSTAHLAASLTQSLAPLATTGLSLIGITANLAAKLSDLSPELAQLAVLGIGLRGPISGAGNMLGKLGDRARTYTAASKGASVATKALNLATAAGPALYVAAGVAIGYFALKAINAKSSTDKLVESMTVANRALGNNLAGYEAMNRALTAQLVPATQRVDAMTKQLAGDVNASNIQLYQGAQAAQALTNEWVSAAKSDVDKKMANVRAGAAALARQYGITSDEAITLADAVGVDMSKGILENGRVVASTAAKFDRYRQAVEMARNPTAVVTQAWKDAANEGLVLEQRVQAVSNAMNAFFTPALGVLSATNRMRDAFAATEQVLKKRNRTAAESSRQLEADLGTIGQWVTAQSQAKRSVQLTDAAIASHLPKLLTLAGNSRVGSAAIEGLASSLGGTITRVKGAIIVTDRLGNRVKVLPNGKIIKLKADNAQANAAISATQAKINALQGRTVYINMVRRDFGIDVSQTGVPWAPKRAAGGIVRRAGGGLVRGPGTTTSDSIPAMVDGGGLVMLSDQEYVINAEQTRRHRALIEAINAGKFAGGGLVERYAGGGPIGYASGGKVSVGGVYVSAAQWRSLGQQLGKDFLKTMSDGTARQIASLDSRLEKAIAKLFGGKRTQLDNKLIAYLDRNSARLESLAKQRDAASKALAAGKEYASGLTSNARSFAGLSALDGPTDARQIRQGLGMKLSQMTRFASLVAALGKRGLSKSLLRQVLDMGPDDGLKYAEMLMAADKGTFSQINTVQKQIDSASTALGRSGADMLYDAGKDAGRGFLAGLQSELKSLDKTMDTLAQRMAKSLKKALKIKSPSQHPEIRAAGAMTVAGVAVGVTSSLGALDQASALMAPRLARPRARPVIAPVVAHRGSSTAAAVSASVPAVNVKVFVGGREVRAAVQVETLRYARRNPSNGLSLPGGG
ncbi:hypothetical protein DQ384_38230 [Sphaerisporangium album]|uniref:Phage tail tape measure protein n=1 Tax=Sphaerisporangium album TaxID=509200 RepID=A0A367EPJ0_9ACTN|nr:hypothetical protein [Sphaerisporangium album]RCG19120.1 hypothetical protein DQ384_38230 [Sphaerisporangium album]